MYENARSTPIPLNSFPVGTGERLLLNTGPLWWGFNPASSVSYYQLQLTGHRLHAVSFRVGIPNNATLREAGWSTLVEVHSGLVLTVDPAADAVRLTGVQDERSAFKIFPMSNGVQLYSAVNSFVPLGVGAMALGSRLRPVSFGNSSVLNVSITKGEFLAPYLLLLA